MTISRSVCGARSRRILTIVFPECFVGRRAGGQLEWPLTGSRTLACSGGACGNTRPEQSSILAGVLASVLGGLPLPSKKRPTPQEITVRKTIFSVLGAALLAASLMQTAGAAEHRHRATSADRAPRNARNQAVAVPSVAQQEQAYWRARELSSGGPSALRY